MTSEHRTPKHLPTPFTLLQVSFCRHQANSKHEMDANAFLSEDSMNFKHWKSGPAGNTTIGVFQGAVIPHPPPFSPGQCKATQTLLAKKGNLYREQLYIGCDYTSVTK